MRLIGVLILILIANCSWAQNNEVRLRGTAPEYAGMYLTVEYQSNYITRTFQELETFKVSKKGSFEVSFSINEVTRIYIDLGEMRGHLLVEPGNTYDITLPQYRPLKEADKMNPFFNPEPIVFGYSKRRQKRHQQNHFRF